MANAQRALPATYTYGMHDAIINGEIVRDLPSRFIYVTAQSDLANLTDEPVGTMAATIGLGNLWQLKADGTWQSM